MVHIVGAGPGAEDLITVRGLKFLKQADIVIYAGSLVNPGLLKETKQDAMIYDSAKMTLEQVMEVIEQAWKEHKEVVRLHTGDPCIYGAIREQMDAMDKSGIKYDICPGVSSFCGTAAALQMEYTLPGISQSVVITRMAGRTPVPERESIRQFASHQATMVVFLSTGMLKELSEELMAGGYPSDTPAAIVYKATWPEEKTVRTTVAGLAEAAERENITKTALIVVGNAVAQMVTTGQNCMIRDLQHSSVWQKTPTAGKWLRLCRKRWRWKQACLSGQIKTHKRVKRQVQKKKKQY